MSEDGSLLFEILNGVHPERWTEAALSPLLDLAGRHGLIGIVVEALRSKGAAVPADWAEIADELALNSRVHFAAAAELTKAFDAANVRAVFAKGSAAALSVYDEPSSRTFVDLDVLIEPDSLRAAADVLKSLGYALVGKTLDNPIECSFTREKLPGYKIEIDLHWSYVSADGLQAPVRIPFGEILDRARIVRSVRIPALEDSILLSAGNMPRKAAQPLMLVVDFQRFARTAFDRAAVIKRATEWHVKTSTWLGFELARKHLNAPVEAAFLTELAPTPERARWLLNALEGAALWNTNKNKERRYTVGFKLMCLDSRQDELAALAAVPKGLLRKMGVTKTLSRKVLE